LWNSFAAGVLTEEQQQRDECRMHIGDEAAR
jgi:hypothetical protein